MMNKKLWQQVAAFQLDDKQSVFGFTQRLAQENGWNLAFARRVTVEYKRFVYLAVAAGHPVTPSDQVDQAWHLHLVYTRSYWEDLCRDVLGKPLHHGPTKGGEAEADKFHDWYERTLASYRGHFDEEPPSDIWPPAAMRFGAKSRFQRVDVNDAWIISKSKGWRGLRAALVAGVLMKGLTACSKADHDAAMGWLFAIIIVVLVIAAAKACADRQPRGRKGRGSSCSTFITPSCNSDSSSQNGHSGCGSSGCGGGCGGGD